MCGVQGVEVRRNPPQALDFGLDFCLRNKMIWWPSEVSEGGLHLRSHPRKKPSSYFNGLYWYILEVSTLVRSSSLCGKQFVLSCSMTNWLWFLLLPVKCFFSSTFTLFFCFYWDGGQTELPSVFWSSVFLLVKVKLTQRWEVTLAALRAVTYVLNLWFPQS